MRKMKSVKKIFSLILVFLLCLSTLSFSVSASDDVRTISFGKNYDTLSLDGEKYVRIYGHDLLENYSEIFDVYVSSSSSHFDELLAISVYSNKDESVLEVEIWKANGEVTYTHYIHENGYKNYKNLYNITPDYLCVKDFPLYEDEFEISYKLIQDTVDNGKKVTIEAYEYYRKYAVCYENGGFYKITGYLIELDDEYYYLDCNEAGIISPVDFNGYSSYDLTATKIENEEFISLINVESGKEKNDAIVSIILLIVLIFVILVLPAVALIVGIVYFRKSQGIYKNIWKTVIILSAIAIFISTIVLVIFFI